MKVYKIFLILILVAIASGAGFYFRNNVANIYDAFILGVGDFKKTDLGNTLSQVGKEILAPAPLKIGGISKNANLSKDKIISETNLQRQQNGDLPALVENSILGQAALAKANDMFKKQYFEHVSPSGVGPAELAKSFGYDYIVEGENLILGNFASDQEAVQDWMNSPGHRANILNKRYTEIGVAVVKGIYKGESVWIGVQEFGLPLASCSEPSESLKNQIELNQKNLDSASIQIEQIRNQINNTDRRSENYNQLINQYNQLINEYNDLSATTKNIISQYNEGVNNFNNCVKGN